MLRIFVILTFLVSWGGQVLFAQNYQTDYEKGIIYLKLKNNSQVELPTITNNTELHLVSAMGQKTMAGIFHQYDVHSITRPFISSYSPDLKNTYKIRFGDEEGIDDFVEDISEMEVVEYAEKIANSHELYTPNDYNNFSVYHLDIINAKDAWDVSQGNSDVVIAVIDAAFLHSHPDLSSQIWVNADEIPNNGIDDDNNGYVDDVKGWDGVDDDNDPTPPSNGVNHEHGTMVASTVAAATNNGIGISAIGFGCKLMTFKTKWDILPDPTRPGSVSGEAIDEGLQYAIDNGAEVINMSFGGLGGSSGTRQQLINEAHARGIVLVGGAGNDGMNAPFYPAALDHVISVAATTSADRKSGFSNYHSTVDLSAPGSNIRVAGHTAGLSPNYHPTQGTSFSCPIVAGLAGLMLSANPCLTPDELEAILKATADNIDAQNPSFLGQLGAGRVNAGAALNQVKVLAAPSPNFTVDDLFTCDGNIQFRYLPDSLAACPTSFVWTIDGQVYTEANPLVKFPQSGTYSVSIIVNNSIGTLQSSQTVTITVGTGIIPVVDAGGDANGQLRTCFGTSNQLMGSSNVPGGVYRWSPTTGLSNPNIPNPTLLASTGITYSLAVTDSAGCVATDDLEVLIDIVAVDAGPDVAIQPGNSAQLNADACGNNLTYAWSPSTGLSMDNIQNPIASPSVSTMYTVTVSDALGNSAVDSVWVDVDPAASLDRGFDQIGTVLLPYPNPAQGQVLLSAALEEAGSLQIEAYDLTGRRIVTIFDQQVGKGDFTYTWDRNSDLPSGVYLLVWRMNSAQHVQKIQLH